MKFTLVKMGIVCSTLAASSLAFAAPPAHPLTDPPKAAQDGAKKKHSKKHDDKVDASKTKPAK